MNWRGSYLDTTGGLDVCLKSPNLSVAIYPKPVVDFIHPHERLGRDSSSYFCTKSNVSH